ncbi:MAG: phenylalanine--tRNA ligase subunit beta, partial [Hyphomicrobiaceae bacterium]
NGPSPPWLQQRLKAVGLRPISKLVDMTNYISLDRGRPLHVYDADKLTGAIRARMATTSESFLALDGKSYTADGTMCVIADDRDVLGYGGIIGGEESGCTQTTTNVLIECAYFDPVRTAETGRKNGIISDARYRFERGVDPKFIEPGLDMATDFVLKLCGGKPSRALMAGRPPIEDRRISFDFAKVRKLTGMDVKATESKRILKAIGCTVDGKGSEVTVAIPSWRPDMRGAADLVEEVIRIVGLDKVPSAAMPRQHGVTRAVLTDSQKRSRRARRILAGRGLVEAITWSFLPRHQAEHFGGGLEALELDNPISVELSSMRPSILPGLLSAAQRNLNRGFQDVGLFELGQAYKDDSDTGQLLVASGVRLNSAQLIGAGRHWRGTSANVNAFDVKADAAAVLTALGVDIARAQITRDAPGWFHPGRSGVIRLGPKLVLAHFGEMHPATLRELDVDGPAMAFEIFLSALPPEKRKSRARAPLVANDLLPVRRDFAFVLEKSVPAGDVVRAASGADKVLIAGVNVFDVFEGGQLGADKKSLAIEVTLQPIDKTLTDAEIDGVSSKIVAAVNKATGGEIRG